MCRFLHLPNLRIGSGTRHGVVLDHVSLDSFVSLLAFCLVFGHYGLQRWKDIKFNFDTSHTLMLNKKGVWKRPKVGLE